MKRTIMALTIAVLAIGIPTAASAAPGQDIEHSCGASFGDLISGARRGGTAAHSNYAGGAAAFSDPAVLAAHGCTG